MKRILSLALVCVMLIGAISAFSISASAEEQTVEIVAKNLYYGETLKLMYAVDAPVLNPGDKVRVSLYVDPECTQIYCYASRSGSVTLDGVDYKKYYSRKGVPIQDINTTFYAKAEILNNGTVVVSSDVVAYSALQYFNELYYTTESPESKTLALAAIACAKDTEAILYDTPEEQANRVSLPVANTKFVQIGENVFGVAQGVYALNSTPFADIASDLELADNQELVWTVTDLDTAASTAYTTDEIKALALTANVSVSVAAVEKAPEYTPVSTTTEIVFGNTIGTQYADETQTFANNVSVSTHNEGCHFTTQLRIYGSNTNNGWATIQTDVAVDSLTFNMGYKALTVDIYGSKDGGTTWDKIDTVSTTTSYKDYTVDVDATAGYTMIKIDPQTTAQLRIAKITVVTFG